MTTDEKAKAYDKAIKKAKEIKEKIVYSHLSTASCEAVSEYIDTIIPELRESEDERIRKAIFKALSKKDARQVLLDNNVQVSDALDWLEKQKEEEGYEAIPVESTLEYKLGFKAGKESEKQKGQKPAEWSEEDEIKLQKCIKIVERWEEDYDIAYAPYSGMLKSLRPSWKPSEEQIKALEKAIIRAHSVKDIPILTELRDKLKAL